MDQDRLGAAVQRYETALLELRKLIPERDPSKVVGEIGCSFCQRPLTEIRDRVLGAEVSICDQCVVLAFELLKEQGSLPESSNKTMEPTR
jgi:hypothetical protein